MKKILLSLTLISALYNAQVTSFPWLETFETDSSTSSLWTKIYESGTKEWTNVQTAYAGYTTGAYQGSYMAQFDITSFDGDTTKYVSPVLDLSSTASPTLEFYYRNRDWGGDQNELKVYYRTSSSAAWILISTYNSSVSSWTTSGVLPLPSPSATYQIALEGVAMYGYSITVDNVTVNASALSTSEVNHKKDLFRVFPNPTSDFVNITSASKISEISIIDFSGKNIKNLKADNTEVRVSVQDLPSGNYIVKVKSSDGAAGSQKFIKK
ncbi:T9SS-dependent choice-of-anchor J family protein [Chryseobacterium paludis]|uniref:T9SS-dependent choice-of-anchor J family protein n=1 Tax=Chryseobacterium paludis TaxID=2956784 RepID=UPI0021C0938B|nr:T9SS type A sorting domain-containing protein [Chryseobacterium paludis]